MFSWPVSSPYSIIHADLYSLVYFTDSSGNVVLVKIICGMVQLVIVVLVPTEKSSTLAEYFM